MGGVTGGLFVQVGSDDLAVALELARKEGRWPCSNDFRDRYFSHARAVPTKRRQKLLHRIRRGDGVYAKADIFRGDSVGDIRIDPAPRWNRTNDAILVPGIAEDNTQANVRDSRDFERSWRRKMRRHLPSVLA